MSLRFKQHSVLPGFCLGLGYSLFWLCLIVLLPLAALVPVRLLARPGHILGQAPEELHRLGTVLLTLGKISGKPPRTAPVCRWPIWMRPWSAPGTSWRRPCRTSSCKSMWWPVNP